MQIPKFVACSVVIFTICQNEKQGIKEIESPCDLMKRGANRRRGAASAMRKPDRSEDTVVHNKKEMEKTLDDSCQCIKTPVGKDADSVQGCKGSTLLWRQQDMNWEKGNV